MRVGSKPARSRQVRNLGTPHDRDELRTESGCPLPSRLAFGYSADRTGMKLPHARLCSRIRAAAQGHDSANDRRGPRYCPGWRRR